MPKTRSARDMSWRPPELETRRAARQRTPRPAATSVVAHCTVKAVIPQISTDAPIVAKRARWTRAHESAMRPETCFEKTEFQEKEQQTDITRTARAPPPATSYCLDAPTVRMPRPRRSQKDELRRSWVAAETRSGVRVSSCSAQSDSTTDGCARAACKWRHQSENLAPAVLGTAPRCVRSN